MPHPNAGAYDEIETIKMPEIIKRIQSGDLDDETFLNCAPHLIAPNNGSLKRSLRATINAFKKDYTGKLNEVDFTTYKKFKNKNHASDRYLRSVFSWGEDIGYLSGNPISPSEEYIRSLNAAGTLTDGLFFHYAASHIHNARGIGQLETFLSRKKKNAPDMNPIDHQEFIFELLNAKNADMINVINNVYTCGEEVGYCTLRGIGKSHKEVSNVDLKKLVQSEEMTDLNCVAVYCDRVSGLTTNDAGRRQGARLFWKYLSEQGKSLGTADGDFFENFMDCTENFVGLSQGVMELYDFAQEIGYIPSGRKTIGELPGLDKINLDELKLLVQSGEATQKNCYDFHMNEIREQNSLKKKGATEFYDYFKKSGEILENGENLLEKWNNKCKAKGSSLTLMKAGAKKLLDFMQSLPWKHMGREESDFLADERSEAPASTEAASVIPQKRPASHSPIPSSSSIGIPMRSGGMERLGAFSEPASTPETGNKSAEERSPEPTSSKPIVSPEEMEDQLDFFKYCLDSMRDIDRDSLDTFVRIPAHYKRRNASEASTQTFKDVMTILDETGELTGSAYANGKRLIFADPNLDTDGECLTFFLPKPKEWRSDNVEKNISLSWDNTRKIIMVKGEERFEFTPLREGCFHRPEAPTKISGEEQSSSTSGDHSMWFHERSGGEPSRQRSM